MMNMLVLNKLLSQLFGQSNQEMPDIYAFRRNRNDVFNDGMYKNFIEKVILLTPDMTKAPRPWGSGRGFWLMQLKNPF